MVDEMQEVIVGLKDASADERKSKCNGWMKRWMEQVEEEMVGCMGGQVLVWMDK